MSEQEQSRAEREALAQAAEAGIHRLPIPTPFMVGRVNAYLIEDSPLTLVDSGPNSAKALDELEQGLRALGHSIEDIELLVITHQHIDHFGLASILARRSGAEVAALAALGPFLARFSQAADLDDGFAEQLMLRHGIPAEIGDGAALGGCELPRLGRGGGAHAPAGRRRRADPARSKPARASPPGSQPIRHPVPGRVARILLAADHLIAHISSNPLLARPLEARRGEYTGPRPQALITYMASLEKTRAMELELVLPGHGRPITDHAALIEERFRMHRRRAQKINRLIAARPRSAHEIAQELWGNVAVTQAYLTLSEVLGHVDLLLNEGLVVEDEADGVVRFQAA